MSEYHHHHDVNSREEVTALLAYTVRHNASHTKELAQLALQLREQGSEAAASLILRAAENYEHGNALLSQALQTLKEE